MSDPATDHINTPEDELEVEANYKPPPEKTIEQILEADKEDESLRKYKETLLGEAKAGGIIVEPQDPRKVIVKKLALCVTGRPDMELDLTGDLTQLKKQSFVIKEGVSYKIRIDFIVQREIVHGLKYVQKTCRIGVPGVTGNSTEMKNRCLKLEILDPMHRFHVLKLNNCYLALIKRLAFADNLISRRKYLVWLMPQVDRMTHMVGSYPPKSEIQSYTTPSEDAPAGVIARGSYTVNSLFTDDDKHEHLKWEWSFDIKKDWKE